MKLGGKLGFVLKRPGAFLRVCLALFPLFHVPAWAVAPTNDVCTSAQVIPAAGPFPYLTAITADITDATTTNDPPLPSCQTDVSRSIWYKFTPTNSAVYTLSVCSAATGTTVADTVMAIYTSGAGCSGPFTEIPNSALSDGCDDDGCLAGGGTFQSVITTSLNGGTAYFIVVWAVGIDPPSSGETAVQLRVSQVSPANDTCATAIPLAVNTPVSGSTALAANNYQLSGSGCFTGIGNTSSTATGRDVVYSFTAPAAGNYSFRVTDYNPPSDLVLYVASTCPTGSPATVSTCLGAANRSSTNTAEEVSCLPLTLNQTVFVFVDEAALSSGSSFILEVTSCSQETESNNTTGTANALACGVEGSISASTDVDFFALGSPTNGSRVFALVDGIAANGTKDFDMRVTTSTDTLEYDNDNNDVLFGDLSPNLAGTPLTGVASFIRINNPSAAEPYRLYAVIQPPIGQATPESEPNDTLPDANQSATRYFSGSLAGPAPSTDVDLFSFSAAAGDLIFLSLDEDPLRNNTPVNAALALLDARGNVLVSVNDPASTSSTSSGAGALNKTTPNSPAEGLVFRAVTNGTYYAQVRIGTTSTGSTGAGDYLLSISKNCQAGGNTPPVAENDSYNTPVNTTVAVGVPGVLENDTDADGDLLFATLVSGTAHGTLSLDPNGQFTYTPATNFVGQDSFTYRANDGQTNSNVATVTISVLGSLSSLQFSQDTYVADEDAGNLVIAVIRTGSTAGTVGVTFATSNDTAVAGADYVATSGALSFGPGETQKMFSVSIIDDLIVEPDETLNLVLSNPTGVAVLGTPSTAAAIILDNDPSLILSSAMFNDSSGGNTNGFIDPGETIRETVVLRNNGSAPASSGTATLLTSASGVTLTQASSTYPSIPDGGTATNLTPFAYRLASTVPCGTTLVFTQIVVSGSYSFTNAFSHTVGQPIVTNVATNLFASSDVPQSVVDLVLSTNLVNLATANIIDDVNVSVRLDHAFDADLEIALQHPDGTEVMLSNNNGGSGTNYGRGACSSTNLVFTTFDDAASTPISSGTAPFAGSFRPVGSLSDLNGKMLNGVWRLRVTDDFPSEDFGTLLCWQIQVVSHQQQYVCSVSNPPPVTSFSGVPTNGVAPLAVSFTDSSTGTITNRSWNFGDGSTTSTSSTNLVHTYLVAGTNTVTLTVSGPGGTTSTNRPGYIVVIVYPPGDVNGDAHVTTGDSALINQTLVGLRTTNDPVFAAAGFHNGDVNQDGAVAGGDSGLINQVAVGLRAYLVTKILPGSRAVTNAPTAVTIYGIGFPTNGPPTVTIGAPVSLTLTNVVVVNREQVTGIIPAGGGSGTGVVNVVTTPTNGVVSFGKFTNP